MIAHIGAYPHLRNCQIGFSFLHLMLSFHSDPRKPDQPPLEVAETRHDHLCWQGKDTNTCWRINRIHEWTVLAALAVDGKHLCVPTRRGEVELLSSDLCPRWEVLAPGLGEAHDSEKRKKKNMVFLARYVLVEIRWT
jgi:hypothetical protein